MLLTPRTGRRWLAALTASAVMVGGATLASGSASAATPQRHQLNTAKPGSLKQPARGDAKTPGPLSSVPAKGRYAFLVKLDTASTEKVFSANRGDGLAAARSASRDHLGAVRSAQSAVIRHLPANTSVLYRSHALVAGVAVTTNVKNVDALSAITGVAKVYPIAPKSYSNSYAVPLQGAPQVWEGKGDRGANTSIAIIDTGIDYTHANFGGPGTTAAYDAALANDGVANPAFPTDKVIGGTDLVGDAYNADPAAAAYDPVPAPDPNPLDCGGHGSHVAGSAAGYGENANGSTYTGAYNTSTPFTTMHIGPGMAPQAKLYAFKVFGCEGSTDVVGAAIDMAADPNGDGDTSDAVDVINMSLGADYGSPADGDSVASNAAVDAGITVAVASGNAGDVTDVGGSPGDANKVITVANSVDASNVIDAVHVSAPAGIAGNYGAERSVAYDWANKPDLSGDLVRLTQSTNLDGCDALSVADAAAVFGKVAFLEWTEAATRRCGSVARSANVVAAGAIGFVFADDSESFSAGITGSATIPGVMVIKSAGDTIRTALATSTVSVDGTTANGYSQNFPGDNDKVNSSSSRGIHATGNVKPDVTAVGTSVFSTAVGTGDDGVSFTGTSMATPMVAGLSALVIAGHPNWTPEQVKADIMNTAGQDLNTNGSLNPTGLRYAPARVGAGRIEAVPALSNDVLAYSASDPGSVSASFGPVQAPIGSATTRTRTIKVQNTGLATQTYGVSYDAITSVNGVSYSVSPSSVTVGPRSSTTVTLTLSIPDASVLNKTVDPTVGRTDARTGYPRETLSEASGRLLFTPTSGSTPTLRVPVYAAPRPVSTMTQQSSLTMPSGASQTATLSLTGGDLGQNGTNGGSTTGTADNIYSLASGFELSATDPTQPDCSTTVTTQCIRLPEEREADVKYVGVTSDAPLYDGDPGSSQAYFAISAQGAFSIPASKFDYEVYIDTNNDHKADLIAYNTRLGTGDVFVVNLVNATTGAAVDTELVNNRFGNTDTALYDSDTLVMPVYLDALTAFGVNASNPRVNFGVVSFSAFQSGPVDTVGFDSSTGTVSLSADVYTPGILVSDAGDGPLVDDINGLGLDVTRNAASYAKDSGQGLLMVHFHNANGNKAQVVALKTASTVTLTVAPTSVKRGTPATLTATVPTLDGVVPTGTVTFKDGTTTVGTGTLNSAGKATASYTPTTVGTTSLTAVYSGDAIYNVSTSAAATLTVTPAASGTTLLVVPTTVIRRHPVSLDASVVHGAGDAVPTGTISVKDANGTTVGTGTLDATGAFHTTYTPVSPGTEVLTAAYSGDANYDPSTSAAVTLTVTKAKSKVKKDLSATSGAKGKTLHVKASVAKDAVTATGKVKLFVNGKKVDSASLSGGKAKLAFTPKHKGSFKVVVKYHGDKLYTSGKSGKSTYKAS